ncbi:MULTISPECIES: dihydrolipoamide acetyltransferase family protein [Staphylococcus]|uniref:dihydrolipoamide acetyltransferase family protein n=1 Tax=Staphylococcus TaxID=1279 RepID=UPI0008A66346|nr:MULTISPECIES: dihydrolipoamide acetyltransferase family protein [Staphylococcus]ARB78935.1 2-oxo acid dehydrogenase subunit E2 [Staphylococcus lugdunensis]ARJ17746.1 branched-chain alpha-keto acid dehydrogenase subunit E2 [Staphylococcus lugdunensis]MBM7134068.1 2-oxo acid dehydrogenase subunit E2 [Staphylococcus lugdunensis]MCH8642151.1 2-oxo acid dehydrogenase subunit E2 [Staphylococcus lugdunensis]MCH8644263.1 2-oxo acid dehydrogenase subunit E2 [Staphylococcus lugdunensis]
MSQNIIMPKLGMTMTEGTVEEWFVAEGDDVNEGDSIATISSEKLTQDIEAPATGTLLKIEVQAGEDAKVKGVLGIIGDADEATDNSSSSTESTNETADVEKSPQHTRIFISPLARNMAEDKALDINRIKGTGGNARITKLDIQRVEAQGYDYDDSKATETSVQTSKNVDVTNIGEGLNPMRKRIAQNMRESLANTAQLTLHRKVDADCLLDFKDKLTVELNQADKDVKLTVTALLAKAVVLALKDYGAMNARYDNGELLEYEDVHLGIATSLEEGLMVPVINEADTKSIGALAEEIKKTSQAVRDGHTDDVQLSGATFTITNMGTSGIEYFTPILNLGETGILGVGALMKEVTLDGDSLRQVSRIPLSLTFDHQILDGAGAAEFLKVLAKYIENPYLLIL